MPKIIDCFPYFDPTGRELLELRVKMLYKYVDEFIIIESNKTHSGIPIERNLRKVLKEYDIPSDKIIIVDLDIPEEEHLQIEPIDVFNCYDEKGENLIALRARARERLQQNAIMSMMYRYNDNDVFIFSCSDEIINPLAISWLSRLSINREKEVLCVPLIYYESRADLRVFNTTINDWENWSPLFFASKKQLLMATPSQIRSNYDNQLTRVYPSENGKKTLDLGWHFSWMGGKQKRNIKLDAWCHHSDKSPRILYGGYATEELRNTIIETEYEEGCVCPSGYSNLILKKYSLNNLPEEVFQLKRVREYLLPNLFY